MTSSAARRHDATLHGPVGRVVASKRAELLDVLSRHGVRNVRVFGSVARGDDRPDSDVDLLVDFPPHTSLFTILRMQDELEEILGTHVDLVSESGLQARIRARLERDLIAL
ncbi:nucleotidyltransferase family protein [Nocardioides sp. NPDC057772]|uniref:nucleotidyltransferase family protein n=1 Tax=Nocardioides sp. NPDC057772 TaxID=3346245 RepID=UPI003670CFAF